MKKLNKKGFTLVELLAVIVILALLIVVVATTALPAMNRAKENSLKVYAQRLQDKAKERYISEAKSDVHIYTVAALTGETQQYKGYVKVEYTGGNYVATVFVLDDNNNIGINGASIINDDVTINKDVTDNTAYENFDANISSTTTLN